MKKINIILVSLISCLAVTGISFIDGKIWEVIFLIVGMITYFIVGILFSIGVLHGKEAGKEAYTFVFFLLLLGGYGVYKVLEKLKLWLISWPLAVKIVIPLLFVISICLIIVLIVKNNKKEQRV